MNSRKVRAGCPFFARCKEFFNSLEISEELLDHTYDMCYCERCHKARGDRAMYARGDPPKDYGMPVGWARFALKEESTPKALKAADKWHRAFHGTPVSCIKPILDVKRLVAAGRNVETGMLEMCHDEEGREDWHVYLSPSIRYAGYYGDPKKFQAANGSYYEVRMAMYVFIDPASYKVKRGKILDEKQRDPNFPDLDDLEWFTDVEGGHHLYGVMVHVEKMD